MKFTPELGPRLKVVKPFKVSVVEEEPKFFVAACARIEEWGYGNTREAALVDFAETVRELYWRLKGSEKRLGKNMGLVWKRLQGHIQEVG